MGASWQAFYAHLCAASIIRAMPETEIPPAMRGDLYYLPYALLHQRYEYQRNYGHQLYQNVYAGAGGILERVAHSVAYNGRLVRFAAQRPLPSMMMAMCWGMLVVSSFSIFCFFLSLSKPS